MNVRGIALTIGVLAAAATATTLAGSGEQPPPRTEPVKTPGRTVFLPHQRAPFDPAKENAVWCATFQMAWDALGRDVLKGPVSLGPPAPAEFVAGMNALPFPLESLDPAACVVAAGTKKSGVLERIAKEGKEKFGRTLPEMSIPLERPDDILAYAFLRKDLPFEHPFERIRNGMQFTGTANRVAAWGLNEDSEAGAEVRNQVRVLFDLQAGPGRGDVAPEFALEFRPKGGRDRIVLASVATPVSLDAAWRRVAAVASSTPRPLRSGEILYVPRIHFDLSHDFGAILGAPILNDGFDGYRITQARQSVLFRMDETGAVLQSEAAIAAKRDLESGFLFDDPFLVALIQDGAKEPYFLLWVANPDLFPK
jgi:hypothetical protein